MKEAMERIWRRVTVSLGVLAIGVATTLMTHRTASAEVTELRIFIQNGMQFVPFAVMKHEKLIEKEAEKAGIKELKVTLQQVAGGNVLNDALISGNADLAATGTAFTVIWAQTKGTLDVKGIAAYNELSHQLITVNPDVKSIKDFGPKDRIALPAVRVSTQAILLQMESEKIWGVGQHGRLDALTISRGHPDAAAALLSGKSEINAHFSSPPFQMKELEIPGAKVVLTGAQVLGASPTGIVFSTSKFRAENPKVYKAFLTALGDSMEQIRADRKRAVEFYRTVFNAKESIDELLQMMTEPGFDFDLTPKGQMKIAQFMYRTGMIKTQPETWKDMFFPEIHQLPGN